MTNKQMEKKIRQAFTNATPMKVGRLDNGSVLSDETIRKGADQPMKSVRTPIQFRAIAALAATIAVAVLVAGVLSLPNSNAGPAARPDGDSQNTVLPDNTLLQSSDAITLAKEYVKKNAPQLLADADWDWEYVSLGDTVVQQFELDSKPYDFIVNVYPDGIITSHYDDETMASNLGIQAIGIDAALAAVKEYSNTLSIYLDFSALTPDSVDWEFDDENKSYYYEINVNHGTYEVEFIVRADNGQVLKCKMEDYERPVDTQGPPLNTEGPPVQNPSTAKITSEQAVEIALQYTGFSKDSSIIRVEEDFDDKVPHYDVELKSEGYEFDFEIRLTDGTILDVEKEFDDDYTPETTTPPDGNIGSALAIQTALNSVGLKASDVWDLECEANTDDGIKHYDVSFSYSGYEYDIEVHMYQPLVLNAEKEPID